MKKEMAERTRIPKSAVRKLTPSTPRDEAGVLARAVEVIGGKDEAVRWMGTPVQALDYATPASLMGSRKGRQTVIAVLGRLEHGVL